MGIISIMFTKNKNIYLIAFFSIFGFYSFTRISIFADQISGGKVSQSLELEIKELLRKVGFSSEPEIRKTSPGLIVYKPNFIFGGYYDNYNFLIIKEDFFSDLAENEKKFWLADTLYSNKYFDEYIKIKRQRCLLYSFVFSQALLASIVFRKEILKYCFMGYSALSLLALAFISNTDSPMVKKWGQLYSDKKITEDFGCIEGAISLLGRLLETENKKYFSDKEIENITTRLANLVSMRKI